MVYAEALLSLFLLLAFSASEIKNKNFLKIVIFEIVAIYALVVGLRDIDYNSDTLLYYCKYFQESVDILSSFKVKLEPLHFLLSRMISIFPHWLLLESLVFVILFSIVLFQGPIIFTAVSLAVSLPLLSSSFRYSLALMLFSALLVYFKGKVRWFFYVLLPMVHNSFVLMILLRKIWGILILFGLLTLAYVGKQTFIIDRLVLFSGIRNFNGLVGTKSLLCFLFFAGLIFWKVRKNPNSEFKLERLKLLRSQVIILILIFILANFVMGLANRLIIISGLMLVYEFSEEFILYNKRTRTILVGFMFFIFAGPQWMLMVAKGGKWSDEPNYGVCNFSSSRVDSDLSSEPIDKPIKSNK